jgi:hypothetical protein
MQSTGIPVKSKVITHVQDDDEYTHTSSPMSFKTNSTSNAVQFCHGHFCGSLEFQDYGTEAKHSWLPVTQKFPKFSVSHLLASKHCSSRYHSAACTVCQRFAATSKHWRAILAVEAASCHAHLQCNAVRRHTIRSWSSQVVI